MTIYGMLHMYYSYYITIIIIFIIVSIGIIFTQIFRVLNPFTKKIFQPLHFLFHLYIFFFFLLQNVEEIYAACCHDYSTPKEQRELGKSSFKCGPSSMCIFLGCPDILSVTSFQNLKTHKYSLVHQIFSIDM